MIEDAVTQFEKTVAPIYAGPYVLNHSGVPYSVEDFIPYGYDEREYNSPGFKLPVGALILDYTARIAALLNLRYLANSESLDDRLATWDYVLFQWPFDSFLRRIYLMCALCTLPYHLLLGGVGRGG